MCLVGCGGLCSYFQPGVKPINNNIDIICTYDKVLGDLVGDYIRGLASFWPTCLSTRPSIHYDSSISSRAIHANTKPNYKQLKFSFYPLFYSPAILSCIVIVEGRERVAVNVTGGVQGRPLSFCLQIDLF